MMIKQERLALPLKKVFWLLVGLVCFSLSPVATQSVQAANPLTITPWYQGLTNGDQVMTVEEFGASKGKIGGEALTVYVTQVVLNVLASALTIIGYATLAFVLYGGFQFIIGMGNSDKMASARKTIINAAIGTVIVLSSSAVIKLFDENKMFDPSKHSSPGDIYSLVLGIFSYALGAVALIVMILSGFTMITSGDKPDSVKKARNGIIFSAIGLVVVIFANTFVKWLIGRI